MAGRMSVLAALRKRGAVRVEFDPNGEVSAVEYGPMAAPLPPDPRRGLSKRRPTTADVAAFNARQVWLPLDHLVTNRAMPDLDGGLADE
jgi:hypothetical protein